MKDSIEERIRIAKYLMIVAADDLNQYAKYNESGQRYVLESAMTRLTEAYQHVFAAQVQHNNEMIGGCKPSSGTSCSASDGGGK